jgi:hypothetical protein
LTVSGGPFVALLALGGILSGVGCAHVGRGVPAVITDPTADSRALHGEPLTLADDALTRDSTLIVERVRPRDENGAPLLGRDTGRPERFRLVKEGSQCVLVHEGTGERYPLESTTCEVQE